MREILSQQSCLKDLTLRRIDTQARRLERLAAIRYAEFAGDPVETESED